MPGELNRVKDKSYSKGKEKRILEKITSKKTGHTRGPPQQTYCSRSMLLMGYLL